jgi:hypothetical protein
MIEKFRAVRDALEADLDVVLAKHGLVSVGAPDCPAVRVSPDEDSMYISFVDAEHPYAKAKAKRVRP